MSEHKNIEAALAAAQLEMGKALKDTQNPHFKSKYADLASVVEACGKALNNHGIAYLARVTHADGAMVMRTVLTHGASETSLECDIPLIVAKNDMQGLGSAMTYARRYGLMSLTGIAPEDDDGNAAAAAAPKAVSAAHMKRRCADMDAEMAECESLVTLQTCWRSWQAIFNNEGWPPLTDDEANYRNYAASIKDKHKSRIEAAMQPLTDAAE